jgi:hypothetical protein
MALVLADRVKETSTTTGTGTITLAGAETGFQAFSGIGDGNSTYYTIQHESLNEWEVGIGTYTASGTTLSRDTIFSSSNSGSAVNFSAGSKFVFATLPASRAVIGSRGYVENTQTIDYSSSITSGSNALSVGPISVDSGVSVTVPSGSTWLVL